MSARAVTCGWASAKENGIGSTATGTRLGNLTPRSGNAGLTWRGHGLDLRVTTPRGMAYTRVGYPARLDEVGEMRGATVDLVTHARSLG